MHVYRYQSRFVRCALQIPGPIYFFTYSRNRCFVYRAVFIALFSSFSLLCEEPTTIFRQWKLRARGCFSLIRPRSGWDSWNLLSRQIRRRRTSSFLSFPLSSSSPTCSTLCVDWDAQWAFNILCSFSSIYFHCASRELGTQSEVEVIFLDVSPVNFFDFHGMVVFYLAFMVIAAIFNRRCFDEEIFRWLLIKYYL